MLKYKNYIKYISLIQEYPKRLEKFKHLKWKKFRLILKKKKKRDLKYKKKKKKLISVLIIKKNLYFWSRKKKKKLDSKFFNLLYNNGLKISNFKNKIIKNRSNTIKKYLLRPLYRINILFWILNWCKSTKEFRYFMFSRKILINNKVIKATTFLKKGDIILFNVLFNKKLNIKTKSATSKKILSFIEVDLYNNSLIVIKNILEINLNDFYLSINSYYNFID